MPELSISTEQVGFLVAKAREFDVKEGRLEYRNRATGTITSLELAEIKATRQDGDAVLSIAGRGTFQGQPFVVTRAELAREPFEQTGCVRLFVDFDADAPVVVGHVQEPSVRG